MSQTLTEIAQQLRGANKKVQLIYAFNGCGKTRLSREFKQLVAGGDTQGLAAETDDAGTAEVDGTALSRETILYYNAFTEDLFYWDNDLDLDSEPRLRIQPNSFTDWVLQEQGQDQNIITNFQNYAGQTLTPQFSADFREVTFSTQSGGDEDSGNLKISKAEESNFVWGFFYTLLDLVISILNVADPENRDTDQFDRLEYVFIDDPVTSLDENHLIELAVNLAALISSSESDLKFIVTTHNPLFYNVLYSELSRKTGYLLERFRDGTFKLTEKRGDSNKAFSYHLHLKRTLEKAIADGEIERYHFTLLRNLYEKSASFLGYPRWAELLPDDKQAYLSRIIQFTSHSNLSNEAVAVPTEQEKNTVELLLNHLVTNYRFWSEVE